MSYTKTQWTNDTAPAINETNLNKIEQGIYDNDSHIGDLSDLETTTNTDLVSAINEVNAKSEIDNTYGTSQTKGYSQEYQNAHNVVVSKTQPTNKSKVWLQHSDNIYAGQITDLSVGQSASFTLTLKPNTNYTMSSNIPLDTSSALLFIVTGTSSTGASTSDNGVWVDRPRTMPTDANGKITIAYRRLNSTTPDLTTFDYKIEEGSSALADKTYVLNTNNDYEEYYNNTFASKNIENYSTDEIRIGTWIDGKPLYRKVISKVFDNTIGPSTMPGIAYEQIDHGISNIRTCVKCTGVLVNTNGSTYTLPVMGYDPNINRPQFTSIHIFNSTTIGLRICNDTWSTNNTFYFECLYTKTTD